MAPTANSLRRRWRPTSIADTLVSVMVVMVVSVVSVVVALSPTSALATPAPYVAAFAVEARRGRSPSSPYHSQTLVGALPPLGYGIRRRRVDSALAAVSAKAAEEKDDAGRSKTNTNPLRSLYPPTVAHTNGTLTVGSGISEGGVSHTLHYEVHGRGGPDDCGGGGGDGEFRTALFLHGGPGAGCNPNHSRFFDPSLYRVVLLDQRGSGKSTPHGEVLDNSLPLILEDIEELRREIQLETWDLILGGSWGVTVAVAYGTVHPDRVRGLVLRGVCLMRPQEVDWLFGRGGGAARSNPGGWREFEDAVGVEVGPLTPTLTSSLSSDDGDDGTSDDGVVDNGADRREALRRYYDCLLGPDPIIRARAAQSWFRWEMGIFSGGSGNAKKKKNDGESKSSYVCLVRIGEGGWIYMDEAGCPLPPLSKEEEGGIRHLPPNEAALNLRQWGEVRQTYDDCDDDTMGESGGPVDDILLPPRPPPKSMTTDMTNATAVKESESKAEAAAAFIPAQAMLTCHYSTNPPLATLGPLHSHSVPLDPTKFEALRQHKVTCVAVQGGVDPICPPDTALELAEAWPEMELRVCLGSGHSMYDPAITNELIRATDRLAMAGSSVQE